MNSSNFRRFLGPDYRLGFLLITPIVILVLGLIAYPFVLAISLSMTDKMIGREASFIGLENYVQLWNDPLFGRTVVNTIKYTTGAVGLKFIVGLGMALAINRLTRGRNILSGILLIPWIIPGIVVAVAWLWMLDPLIGIINYIIVGSGLVVKPPGWLGDMRVALLTVTLVNVWRGFPFFGVTFAAGLKTIPMGLYEAAKVDGAGPIQRFLHITIPGLSVVWPVVLLLSVIWTFNDFVTVFVLTKGGPAGATHIIGTLSYEIGIGTMQMGKGIAISLYSAPLLVIIIILYAKFVLKKGTQ